MYEYDEMSTGVVIQKVDATGSVTDEVFLQGDEAVTFLREMNRAGQKERSKRRNPNNIPICQHLTADYFTRG
jgi:hypothetical protein